MLLHWLFRIVPNAQLMAGILFSAGSRLKLETGSDLLLLEGGADKLLLEPQ